MVANEAHAFRETEPAASPDIVAMEKGVSRALALQLTNSGERQHNQLAPVHPIQLLLSQENV